MTDDNLRHRERILPTEKAQSLKMQVEAIKHQGSRPGEEDKDAGKTLHAGRGRSQQHELQAGTAVYCRVAHDDSFSLERQAEELPRYAEQAGYTIVGAAAEHGSGMTP